MDEGTYKVYRETSDNVFDMEYCLYDFGSIENHIKINSKDLENILLQISIHQTSLGPARQPTVFWHDTNDSILVKFHKSVRLLYDSLAKITITYHEL